MRGAIANSDRIISWSDIERFDVTESASDPRSREFNRDSLFVDPAFYRDTMEKYKAIPYWKKHKSGLITCRNSMERLLWLLEHPFEAAAFAAAAQIRASLSRCAPAGCLAAGA